MMNALRAVTIIPQTIRNHEKLTPMGIQKRRVAAYARVSTDLEEQQTSFEAQVDYYTRHNRRILNGSTRESMWTRASRR